MKIRTVVALWDWQSALLFQFLPNSKTPSIQRNCVSMLNEVRDQPAAVTDPNWLKKPEANEGK
jgi:hypothetical protein